MTTFKFTPACCCGTVHECGDGYGLQTYTSTDMVAFSDFMQGWNGSAMVGLHGYPGDPWFQTFIHDNGDVEYRTGVYLPNGMIDPTEARIYTQELEGIKLAGFQNCRRITFNSDTAWVWWEPFSYLTLNTIPGSYGILPDEYGHRYLYYNIPRENLELITTVDLATLIRDQDPNHHGQTPVAITRVSSGGDSSKVRISWGDDAPAPPGISTYFESTNEPFYQSLESILNYQDYFWRLSDYPYDSVSPQVCDFDITGDTEITLRPENGFINFGGDFMLRYHWRTDLQNPPASEPDNSDLTRFLTDYNLTKPYLPDLTEITPVSDYDLYTFGIRFHAVLWVDTWYANYLGN